MKSSIDPSELIAVARISSFDKKSKVFHITYGGDALTSLKIPFSACILLLDKKPVSSSEILIPASRGLKNVEGRYVPVDVASLSLNQSRGSFKLKTLEQLLIEELPDNFKGSWLCIEKRLLENTSETYLFQFLGSKIYEREGDDPVATVVDYFDNGSHGVLITKTTTGKEVLIPFVDHYVKFNKQKKTMLIPEYNLFLVQ